MRQSEHVGPMKMCSSQNLYHPVVMLALVLLSPHVMALRSASDGSQKITQVTPTHNNNLNASVSKADDVYVDTDAQSTFSVESTTNKTTSATTTTTPPTPTQSPNTGLIIATAVSSSVAGFLILCCIGICVYIMRQDSDGDCCLCCCCGDYDDHEECCDAFKEGCVNCWCCLSRCKCAEEPDATPMIQCENETQETSKFIKILLPDETSKLAMVRGTDKIRVIKAKVLEQYTIPRHYVNVYRGFSVGQSDVLDEEKSFMEYGINLASGEQVFSVTIESHNILIQFADNSLEEQAWDPLLTVGQFLHMLDLKMPNVRQDMLKLQAQWESRAGLHEMAEDDKKRPIHHLRKLKVSVSFQVVLKIFGQNTQKSVKVFPTDTTATLTKLFPTKSVIFHHDGTQLEGEKLLKEYGLTEGSVVTVNWTLKVSVARGSQTYTYNIVVSNTIGDLKQILAVDTDIHVFEQHLSFNGNVLHDDRMFADYLSTDMEDEIHIVLTSQPWRIAVLLPTGTLREYQVSPNNNVAFLKQEIEKRDDIPAARQILQVQDNSLTDENLLCDSIIPTGSLVYLREQLALKYSVTWTPVSNRWRPFFNELLQVNDGNLKEVNNVCFCTKIDKFKIGFGNKTEVFLGIRHDGREVAVKRFPRSMSQNFKNEKCLLTTLDSPNIIRYLDIATDDEFLYLILELGEFTLNEFISTDEYKQNQTEISRELVGQILESLKTLHTGHNVIHMDIKPHNVLIDVGNRAKLSDFGISIVLPENQSTFYTTAKGTYHWVAKEILDSATGKVKYKTSTDIQVAGMLVYYTLTGGTHPFMPNGEADIFICNKNVQDGKHDLSALGDIVGRHLVQWMLDPDPTARPTIEEAMAHPFLWNVDMRYRFLGVIGDEKEVKESWKQQHPLTLKLDGRTGNVFKNVRHWKELLDQAVFDEMEKKLKNGYRATICGLLRFIRNLDVHLKDQSSSIQSAVGNTMTYLSSKLPLDDLFMEVYLTVRQTRSSADDWTTRDALKEFFPA